MSTNPKVGPMREALHHIDEEFNSTYINPESIQQLQKTLLTFNITIQDWNTLVNYIKVLGSVQKAMYLLFPSLTDYLDDLSGPTTFTMPEKEKLENIESGAQVNVIESIKVNGTAQTITNKEVNIVIPTAVSDLVNDAAYITNAVDGLVNYSKTSEFASVAFSNDYADLDNVPTKLSDFTNDIVGNGTLTIQKNGTTVDTFNSNASADKTINITVPTALSGLSDDSTHRTVTDTEKSTWGAKQNAITSSSKLSADLVDDTNTTHKFVTSQEKITWNAKQNALTFDSTPTEDSTNPIESGAVYEAISDVTAIANGKTKTFVISDAVISGKENDKFNSPGPHVDVLFGDTIETLTGENFGYNDLKLGDIVLVKETDVPDWWVGYVYTGTGTRYKRLYKMETTKVDLSPYALKSDLGEQVNYVFLDGVLTITTKS